MPGDVLIPGPTSQGSPGIRRWSALLLMQGPLPHGGGVCTRRHLVASSAAWGPCPTAAVFMPGDVLIPGPTSQGSPGTRRWSALLLMQGPLPYGGGVCTRRHLVASSAAWGPCPTAAVFMPGDVLIPGPTSQGSPGTRRWWALLLRLGPLPQRSRGPGPKC